MRQGTVTLYPTLPTPPLSTIMHHSFCPGRGPDLPQGQQLAIAYQRMEIMKRTLCVDGRGFPAILRSVVRTCPEVLLPLVKQGAQEEKERNKMAYERHYASKEFQGASAYVYASMTHQMTRKDHGLVRSHLFNWDMQWDDKKCQYKRVRSPVKVNGLALKGFSSNKVCKV